MPEIIILIVEYESAGRILRSRGKIVEVQFDNVSRPPKDSDLNAAIHWLAKNGYEPVLSEFRYVRGDRPGTTTFKPRKKQVYQRNPLTR